ncbi:heterokaryon incompatibility protein-domain-containing protein [Cladorrhinum sp. PSN332]|nr:heterokaryon incompatibility protein-domain-containing protein [Cladorrhinum sp. PSN332]
MDLSANHNMLQQPDDDDNYCEQRKQVDVDALLDLATAVNELQYDFSVRYHDPLGDIADKCRWRWKYPSLDAMISLPHCKLCLFFYECCQRHPSIGHGRHASGLEIVAFDRGILFPRDKKVWNWFFGTTDHDGIPFQVTFNEPDTGNYLGDCSVFCLAQDPAQILERHYPSKIDYSIVRFFLDTCDEQHAEDNSGRGQSESFSIPNLRVIDCETRGIVSWTEIEETAEHRYTTLSYVWGTADTTTTSSADPNTMPDAALLVIEDAIQVTKFLGLRYLWIDRYCIPQDDEAARWAQIQNMGVIYQRSYLTIIAAAGEGPSYGLPAVSSRKKRPRPLVKLQSKAYLVCPPSSPSAELKTSFRFSKWNTRGWTYQEGALSKRRLLFTDSLVQFSCVGCGPCLAQSCACVEGIDCCGGLNSVELFPTFIKTEWPSSYFYSYVGRFWPRALTNDGDALAAFTGILKEFESLSTTPIHSLFGLPIPGDGIDCSVTVFNSLRWDFVGLWQDDEQCLVQRRREFPSWTWLGWKTTADPVPEMLSIHSDHGRDYRPPPGGNLPRGMDLSVELGSGRVVRWEGNSREILEEAAAGRIPRVLRITGFTFRLRITRAEGTAKPLSDFYALAPYHTCPISHLDIATGCYNFAPPQPNTSAGYLEFTCLVFSSENETTGWGEHLTILHVLVLLSSSEADTFERVEWLQLSLINPEAWGFTPGSDKSPDPTWKLDTIRLA